MKKLNKKKAKLYIFLIILGGVRHREAASGQHDGDGPQHNVTGNVPTS